MVGLAAGRGADQAVEQAREHGVPRWRWQTPPRPSGPARCGAARCWTGEEGIAELIASSGADLVLNGIVGAAGLGPTIVALSEGIDVALANKESLVIGGELVTALAEGTGARLLPVDSEHSALFQLIRSEPPGYDRAPRPDRLRRAIPGAPATSPGSPPPTPSITPPGRWAGGSRSTRRH